MESNRVATPKPPRVLQSVDGALAILEVLAGAGAGMALADIAAEARRPKASVYRVLQTFVRRGYARALGGGVYAPGPTILTLAGRMRADLGLVQLAGPILRRLESVTLETIHLALYTGSGAIYVEKIEARDFFAVQSYVGMAMKLHCTAIGKCILAYLPAEERRRVLGGGRLERSTPQTLTTLSSLEEELRKVQANGYAIDDEENHVGIRCVGAPIFREDGSVLGGVSVTSPAFRFSVEDAVALAPRVREVADAISSTMGWRGVRPNAEPEVAGAR
jgi:DNA-binding IclR family transcriptional regulator